MKTIPKPLKITLKVIAAILNVLIILQLLIALIAGAYQCWTNNGEGVDYWFNSNLSMLLVGHCMMDASLLISCVLCVVSRFYSKVFFWINFAVVQICILCMCFRIFA